MLKRSSPKVEVFGQSSLKAFIKDHIRQDPTVATPVRYLWKHYQSYCIKWGFDQISTREFVRFLRAQYKIKRLGKGRVRAIALEARFVKEE